MKDARTLQEVLSWMKGTDLAEVSYRRGEDGLCLRSDAAPAASVPPFPPCSLSPVNSPEVGLFRWGSAGSAGRLEKGAAVSAGQPLCRVQVGRREVVVASPASGRLVSVLADDGDPLEFGQPLFFIRPE